MFGLRKKSPKYCSAEDVRGFLLLFWGREASHDVEIERHVNKSVYTTLRSFLSSQEFLTGVQEPLSFEKQLAWVPYTPEQQKILSRMAKRILGIKLKKAEDRTKALMQASRSHRFLQIIEESNTGYRAADFVKKIDALFGTQVPQIYGVIEDVRGKTYFGYAFDKAREGESLTLDFYANGYFIGTTKADGLRRDIEEQHPGFKHCGFSFDIVFPPHLAALDQLVISVFDHDSRAPICPPRIMPNIGVNYALNIVRFTEALNKAAEKAPHEFAGAIEDIRAEFPSLKQYATFPIEAYEDVKHLFKKEVAPALRGKNAIALSLSAHADLKPTDHAKGWFEYAAANNPDAVIFFSDHESMDENGAITPIYKAGFDYDELLGRLDYPKAFAVKDDVLSNTPDAPHALWLEAYEKFGEKAFCHVPQILFEVAVDAQAHTPDEKTYISAVTSHFKRLNIQAEITYEVDDPYAGVAKGTSRISWPLADKTPLMAIIIPTRDALELTRNCVESLRKTLKHHYATEIIIVDNGSTDPNTKDWLRQIDGMDGMRVLVHDAPFNWAELNNLAVDATEADYLLFLNNDTVALDYGWDHILRGYLNRNDIGAVGGRLLFEDGTLQYGGYILDHDNIILKEAYAEWPSEGYNKRSQIAHHTSALIGAFLACRRSVYKDAGGFDAENFAVAFNDVDFSLAVLSRGLKNIYVPAITFQHLESKSRGYDAQDKVKEVREKREREKIRKKWRKLLVADRYYSPLLLAQEPTYAAVLSQKQRKV